MFGLLDIIQANGAIGRDTAVSTLFQAMACRRMSDKSCLSQCRFIVHWTTRNDSFNKMHVKMFGDHFVLALMD